MEFVQTCVLFPEKEERVESQWGLRGGHLACGTVPARPEGQPCLSSLRAQCSGTCEQLGLGVRPEVKGQLLTY